MQRFRKKITLVASFPFTDSQTVDTTADTVDGSEIRRAPVEVGSLSHYLQGFITIPGGAGFLPSTVVFKTLQQLFENPCVASKNATLLIPYAGPFL